MLLDAQSPQRRQGVIHLLQSVAAVADDQGLSQVLPADVVQRAALIAAGAIQPVFASLEFQTGYHVVE